MVNGFRNITEASHSSTRCACDEETTHFGYQGLCPVKPGKLGNPQSGGRGGSIFLPAEGCWSLAVTHVSPPAALSTRGGMHYSFLPCPTHFLFPGPYKCKQPHSPNAYSRMRKWGEMQGGAFFLSSYHKTLDTVFLNREFGPTLPSFHL